jgi:hypothetical protein
MIGECDVSYTTDTQLIAIKSPDIKQKKTDVDFLQQWRSKTEKIAFWRVSWLARIMPSPAP